MPSNETDLLHFGDDRFNEKGAINTPVYRASLFSFESMEAFSEAHRKGAYVYSRDTNPTRTTLETKIAHLEKADRALALSSGMAAISLSLIALVKTGDHILVAHCCYGPTRQVCDTILKNMGVEVEYFSSSETSDLSPRIKPNTSVIYLESPGSATFQIQDLRAVAKLAKANNIYTIIDNTWATPLFQNPIALGIDVVVHTATKYIAGHSDAVAGLLACNEELYKKIQPVAEVLGAALSPDDSYLVTRGLRTLAVRLKEQGESAMKMARWLQQRPEILRVLHPGLPEFPGYELAKTQLTGYTGLFSFSFKDPAPIEAQFAFVDALKLYGKGVSWGGYESLLLPMGDGYRNKPEVRESMGYDDEMYRVSVGLEGYDDLIADLENAFAARAAAIEKLQVPAEI